MIIIAPSILELNSYKWRLNFRCFNGALKRGLHRKAISNLVIEIDSEAYRVIGWISGITNRKNVNQIWGNIPGIVRLGVDSQ